MIKAKNYLCVGEEGVRETAPIKYLEGKKKTRIICLSYEKCETKLFVCELTMRKLFHADLVSIKIGEL